MTPAARIQAAIEVLDRIAGGLAAEKALLNWSRASRFAGSGDRAAVRDHVFDALRCWRSFAALGGAQTGRGRMLGALRKAGVPVERYFDGSRHGPHALTDSERAHLAAPVCMPQPVALDCPDWLVAQLRSSLGPDFVPVMEALQRRAPVHLRANLLKCGRAAAIAALEAQGFEAQPSQIAGTAIEVAGNPRRLRESTAFAEGLVELQDAASQAVVEALPLAPGQRVLDYCAGGGGKALAMAARIGGPVHAHDADPQRMADLPGRAARAGARITRRDAAALERQAPFDLVLVDAPCSGSGSWRRTPEAKWRLTPERLQQLRQIQQSILARAAGLVVPGGCLAYATCSLLESENEESVAGFLRAASGWSCTSQLRWSPHAGADGFFLAILTRG